MPPGLSSAMTLKRIQREIVDLKKEELGPMILEPSDDNIHIWKGSIPGPQGSLYDGGIFDLEIVLPADYPFSAPKVLFKTRIYHMNISEHGNICIDILKQNWSPALSLFKVMLSLSSLLTDPNPKDPLVPSIAQQYLRHRKEHDATARQWTQLYARPKPPPAATTAQGAATSVQGPARGKKRAPAASNSNGDGSSGSGTRRTTRSSGASTSNELDSDIIVLDSDPEMDAGGANAKGKKRKRDSGGGAAAQGSTSGNTSAGEVLYLVDSDDELEAVAARRSRARPKPSSSRAEQQPRNPVAGTSSSTRRPVVQLGEVIVID